MNLTKPQKLIYDMEKYAGGAISVICGGMLIRGEKETAEMQAAVNELYRLNDALRIRVSESDGTASQKITEYAEQNIPVLRFESKAEIAGGIILIALGVKILLEHLGVLA